MESDEAFARRLQAQEMGLSSSRINDNTPLMQSSHAFSLRTPINSQMQENDDDGQGRPRFRTTPDLSTNRATVIAIVAVHLPQILATIIVLSTHWRDPILVCDSQHEEKWRLWASFSAIRMTVYTVIVVSMNIFRPFLDERPSIMQQLSSFRNMIDGLGLIWFVVGNMWLFGDDDNTCRHPEKSPIYNLCFAMLIINYVQICLPCLLAILMIPIFCFCMPCLIRLMARLNNRAVQGATTAAIDTIPLVTLGTDVTATIHSDDLSCPICLNDMVTGDEVRLLSCNHNFHRQCVDEWLRVNASCPTCRKSILREAPNNQTSSNNETSTFTPMELERRNLSRTVRL